MAKLVSKTYGEALFEIADKRGKRLELMEEIVSLRQIINENPEFDKLMKHPGIPKQDKVRVMENIFKGRVSDEITGFLAILITKERYSHIQSVFEYFIAKVKEAEKIGVAYVTTAVELNNAQKDEVNKKLLETTGYRRMEIHFEVDKEIIGGMVIRIGDRVVDSSIKNKINDLTKQLLQIQLG